MRCNHCRKTLRFAENPFLSQTRDGGTGFLVTSECCGYPYHINRIVEYSIEPVLVPDRPTDDFGDEFKGKFTWDELQGVSSKRWSDK